MLEVQEDFLTAMEAGVVVEVLTMMELGVWDTLKSVVEEEVSGVEASNLSSVVVGGAVPRPGLVPAGSLVEVEVSTVCTAGLLQPSPGG